MTDAVSKLSRRAALAKLGLLTGAAYLAPALTTISFAQEGSSPSAASEPSAASAPSEPRAPSAPSEPSEPSEPSSASIPSLPSTASVDEQTREAYEVCRSSASTEAEFVTCLTAAGIDPASVGIKVAS